LAFELGVEGRGREGGGGRGREGEAGAERGTMARTGFDNPTSTVLKGNNARDSRLKLATWLFALFCFVRFAVCGVGVAAFCIVIYPSMRKTIASFAHLG
jgi:hypothetical protein